MTSFGLAPARETIVDEVESSLRSLEPLLTAKTASPYVSKRLIEAVTRLFQVAGSNGMGARLERVVLLEVDSDFAEIRAALRLLEDACAEAGKRESLAKDFEAANAVLSTIEKQFTALDRMELGLRLELIVNRVIGRALEVIPRPNAAVDQLVSRVTKKLGALDVQQRAVVWAKITREVEVVEPAGFDHGVPIDEAVVERSFFDVSSAKELPEKIARYLVDYRPRLVAAAAARGQQAFPFPPLALAVVLGWKEYPFSPSDNERRLAQHMVLLAHLATTRLDGQPRDLANALSITESARLLSGITNEKLPDDEASVFRIVIAECQAVAALVSRFVHALPGYEFELLRRYKLSKEFAVRENRALLQGKNEEYCQRDLAAFLIQHGVYAVGTRFGPQETDLVTGTTVDPLIIEAKLFRSGMPATGIKKAMVQLHEYMDKAPFKSRGALILFNLTEVCIVAPRELVDGRVAVVAVNLPDKTASKHDQVCVISPANGGDLIEVVVTKELASGKSGSTKRNASQRERRAKK